MSHSNDSTAEYAWFLPGETIQATFDEDIELSLTSSPDSAANGITNSIPLVPSTHSSLNPFDARKTTGPFASLRTAAGNVFQGKDSQESSTDLPQYHHQHNIRQYIRNRTHSHQDQPRKFQQTPASSPSQFSRQSPAPLPKKQRLVITNFRICSLQQIPDGHHMIRIQIALGTIATIALQEPQKIIITLKFDSPQFTILQHPPGSPAVAEVMSNLCRLVFNTETRLRFPYQMGSSIVGDGYNPKAKTKDDGPINASLWTAEEIFTLSPKTCNNATTKNQNASISEDHHLRKILGWTDGYDILNEFKRLQFDESQWSVVNLNEDFELSPTYPERFIMPNAFLDSGDDLRNPVMRYSSQQDYTSSSPHPDSPSACIKQLVAFRSNKRFPIVCWKSPETGLILMRSSQPMVGFLGSRGAEDELYIRTVLNTAARECRRSHVTAKFTPKLCIMDARAITSAIANGCKGGGRENPDHYLNATISYMSLGNIHVIASSHQALLKAISTQSETTNWFTLLESTGWLNHVTELLKAASGRDGIVGKMLEANCSVLVHCTDGWDRTTQLVSLAQILLDPYYRTIQGLRVLIEKEWLSCGHPFQARTDALPNQKKPGFPYMDDEPLDYRRYSTTVLHSSPNGSRESISFARKWRNSYLESEPKIDTKPIPPFSYHMESEISSIGSTYNAHTNYPTSVPPTISPPSSPHQSKSNPVLKIPVSPSPVFLLFLTCLHHIVQQHPCRFEYNDYLLVVLARAASGASPFGDFLYNNECERSQDKMRQRTPSIWKWIQENQGWFKNRDYVPEPNYRSQTKNDTRWREQVLQVQTGGRFVSIWSEYYFSTTPTWLPDPCTVLSTALFHSEGRDRPLLMSLRRQVGLCTDPWYSSQFDPGQLQKLTFPGLHSTPDQLYQHQPNNDGHPRTTDLRTIPPVLAQLSGQDMHLYYLLVQRLRERRRKQVKQAFLKWQSWAKRRLEEKPAREDGWGLVGNSAGSSQDDSIPEHDDSDDGYDDEYVSSRVTTPELKVVMAKMGIEMAMERVLEGEPFFGDRPLVFEPESDDEYEIRNSARSDSGGLNGKSKDRLLDIEALEDSLEGDFDDFGFPVTTDDYITV